MPNQNPNPALSERTFTTADALRVAFDPILDLMLTRITGWPVTSPPKPRVPTNPRPDPSARRTPLTSAQVDRILDPQRGMNSPYDFAVRDVHAIERNRRLMSPAAKAWVDSKQSLPDPAHSTTQQNLQRQRTTDYELYMGGVGPRTRALLDTIADHRLEDADYNTLFGGSLFDDYSSHPFADPHLKRPPSTAAGRGQMVAGTFDLQRRALGLKDFAPPAQDVANADLAAKVYRARTGRSLETDLGDPAQLPQVTAALNSTWSSLPGGSQQRISPDDFGTVLARNLSRAQAAQTPKRPHLPWPPG